MTEVADADRRGPLRGVRPDRHVTLNRPEARNALSAEVRRLLWAIAGAGGADDAVDVVILTGADPAFCAGLDLKELGAGDPTERQRWLGAAGRGRRPRKAPGRAADGPSR